MFSPSSFKSDERKFGASGKRAPAPRSGLGQAQRRGRRNGL